MDHRRQYLRWDYQIAHEDICVYNREIETLKKKLSEYPDDEFTRDRLRFKVEALQVALETYHEAKQRAGELEKEFNAF